MSGPPGIDGHLAWIFANGVDDETCGVVLLSLNVREVIVRRRQRLDLVRPAISAIECAQPRVQAVAAVELQPKQPFFFCVEHGKLGAGVYRDFRAPHHFQQAQCERHLLFHPRVAGNERDAKEIDVVGL